MTQNTALFCNFQKHIITADIRSSREGPLPIGEWAVGLPTTRPSCCVNFSHILQVLREVKYLAGLNHKYVVRYHGAWFEYQNPVPTFATVDSTNFPAIKSSPEDSDSSSRYNAFNISLHN